MRPIGFSTGALAKGDFHRGLAMQQDLGADAIELSALREHELPELARALHSLDLRAFTHVSIHAPSNVTPGNESMLVDALDALERLVIVHPNVIAEPAAWRTLGARLCIENMDGRKPSGRTPAELAPLFSLLPDATFCLDLGHARQLDRDMTLAHELIEAFGARLVQLHVSEVGGAGEHWRLSRESAEAFRLLVPLLPRDATVIIESPVAIEEVGEELAIVRAVFG